MKVIITENIPELIELFMGAIQEIGADPDMATTKINLICQIDRQISGPPRTSFSVSIESTVPRP